MASGRVVLTLSAAEATGLREVRQQEAEGRPSDNLIRPGRREERDAPAPPDSSHDRTLCIGAATGAAIARHRVSVR